MPTAQPRRASIEPSTNANHPQTRVSTSSGSGPDGQPSAADGSAADRCATAITQSAHQVAAVPTGRPSGTQTEDSRPPPRPSTVAGATTGAASRLATTATRLTWPEIAATTGVHASCAASGTDSASAAHRGSHRHSASRQPGARNTIPAVASTDSANPTSPASHGSNSISTSTASPSARGPRCRPLLPMPTSATEPITAARSTLGSGRASSTNPTTPTAPATTSPRARTPHRPREHQQRADDQRQVGARHGQQVGQTGSAEVGSRPLRQADVVTVDQRRHQCARLGRPVCHRLPDALAHARGTAQQRSVARQHFGLAVREVDRAEVVAVGRRQAPGRPHRLAEVQRAPPDWRDHEHRLVQPPGQPTCCHPGRGRAHQDVAGEPSHLEGRVARELEPNLGGDLLRGEPRQRTGADHLDPEQCTTRDHHGDQQPDHELGRLSSPAMPPRQNQRTSGDDQGAVQPSREVQPSKRGQPGDHTQRRCPQVGSWCVGRVLELVVLVTVHLLTTSRAVRCRRVSCPRCRRPRAARRRT